MNNRIWREPQRLLELTLLVGTAFMAGLSVAAGQMETAGQDVIVSIPVAACSPGPSHEELPFSDSHGSYQWAYCNSGIFKLVPETPQEGPAGDAQEGTWAQRGIDINLLPAWEAYEAKKEKRQAVVALIDTGVDYTHPELKSSLWMNEDEIPGDGVDNDGNGYIDDVCGWNFCENNPEISTGTDDNHGTHSAGTIAAARDGVGTVGICDSSYIKVMVLKTLEAASGTGTADDVAEAIRYAEKNGAVICNLSFGTEDFSDELYETMKYSKMLFVVAAGNGDENGSGYDIDGHPVYPAAFDLDNIISVASLRFDGSLDPTSNYGAAQVDLAAPGSYILSTMAGGGYGYMSGTSMAAPMVSGAAALLYSSDVSLSVRDVRKRLLESVRPLAALEGKLQTGGMLDVGAALEFADETW